jgi:hypothetical protein
MCCSLILAGLRLALLSRNMIVCIAYNVLNFRTSKSNWSDQVCGNDACGSGRRYCHFDQQLSSTSRVCIPELYKETNIKSLFLMPGLFLALCLNQNYLQHNTNISIPWQPLYMCCSAEQDAESEKFFFHSALNTFVAASAKVAIHVAAKAVTVLLKMHKYKHWQHMPVCCNTGR